MYNIINREKMKEKSSHIQTLSAHKFKYVFQYEFRHAVLRNYAKKLFKKKNNSGDFARNTCS